MISQSDTKTSIDNISGLNLRNEDLDSILVSHPYFQLGLVEKSRRLRKENHIDAIKYARKCAILFPDRSLLYKLIHESEGSSEDVKDIEPDRNDDQIEPISPDETIDDNQEIINDQKEKDHEPDKVDSTLEKEYLIEAINQSLQIEMDTYQIEDEFVKEEKTENTPRRSENIEILSFSEWLKNDDEKETLSHSFKSDLIDKFIQESPNISRIQEKTFYSPIEKGKESLSDIGLPYSETLASIFVQQGNKELAIKAYKHLLLKNPQKSVYFADLIKKLEEKI